MNTHLHCHGITSSTISNVSSVRSLLCWAAGSTVILTRSADFGDIKYLLNDVGYIKIYRQPKVIYRHNDLTLS